MRVSDLDSATIAKLQAIRLVSLDVDGVLTDGRIIYSSDGTESKAFHVHDGQGIRSLQAIDIQVAIVTARESSIVTRRGRELGIVHIFQGATDKVGTILSLAQQLGLSPAAIAHVGDDINDLKVFGKIGLGVVVPNAPASVRQACDLVLSIPGGLGAVREFCDLLIEVQDFASE